MILTSKIQRSALVISAIFLTTPLLIGCSRQGSPLDHEAHRLEIEQWRQERLKKLTAEDGWLTLCGLWWLHEGENSCGGDSSSDVMLPQGKAPDNIGSFHLSHNTVRFITQKDVAVTHNDSVVEAIDMRSDRHSKPTILKIGTLRFHIIDRGGKLGVRVKDSENPTRINFRGLDYFPIDSKWRAEATFEPYSPPKELHIPTMANTMEDYLSPGSLVFAVNGSTFHIDALIETGSEDKLFIMYGDETNGKETYGGGRQMYTQLPDSNNNVVLDFNRAYNWPCVFTEYATCPIIPKQNVIPLRIEAGEKMYAEHE